MKFDPEKHHRQSIRLKDYDYSQAGMYFVTVCALNKECLFGDVVNGEMVLNEFGEIILSQWKNLPSVVQGIKLDAFVVMPNHIHGIVAIVGAIHESPLQRVEIKCCRNMILSKIVGRLKMVSAKQINLKRKMPGISVWQRNYYEHIIRDETSLNRIREYIVNNPLQWELDSENPLVGTIHESPPLFARPPNQPGLEFRLLFMPGDFISINYWSFLIIAFCCNSDF